MKLLLVPHWLEKALSSEGHDLKEVLNPEILFATVSREDVAFYIFLNRNLTRWLPQEILHTFTCGDPALGFKPHEHNELEDQVLGHTISAKHEGVKNNSTAPNTCELFGPLSEEFPLSDISYTIRCINYDTIVVLPQKAKGNTLMGTVNDLLFQLNSRMPFEKLAQTSLFKLFLRLA